MACARCGRARGLVYAASVYTAQRGLRGRLCPWCVADGSAARRFDATFNDDCPLIEAGVDDAVVEEVCCRTPGYSSWQQEVWQACCGDACAFHGDATREHLATLAGDDLDRTLRLWRLDAANWPAFVSRYEPGGGASVFRFVCLRCGRPTFALDFA